MTKFKKLRKIYRILFPIDVAQQDFFQNTLTQNSLIAHVEKKNNNLFHLTLRNNLKVIVRGKDHSDYSVFKQIFNFEEYNLIYTLLKNNNSFLKNESVLIDAGANVGYTTMFFSHFLNFKKIICIEPSIENVKILNENIKSLHNYNAIIVYQRALTNSLNLNFSLDTSFRDQKDWSITTTENELGDIKGITINEIIQKHNLKEITVLKIDIEGAERFIFTKDSDLDFLKIVKILAIEIHDEFNIRGEINEILIDNNFMIFESGELTIGINKNLL